MRDSATVTYQWVLNDFIVQNHDALIAGLHRPLVFPLDFVNYGLLITYLFATRYYSRIPRYVNWAVFLIIVWVSVSTMRECRSLGMSYGIGIGLMSSWCILLSANLLIYHNPKEDFLRISRRQGRISLHQDLLSRKQSSGYENSLFAEQGEETSAKHKRQCSLVTVEPFPECSFCLAIYAVSFLRTPRLDTRSDL